MAIKGDTPRIYVGTYAKYNNGSIKGAWLDLEDYADKDAFLEACRELHKDESDPEFMFQDFEGFPRSYYSESSVPAELWDEYLDLDEHDRKMLAAYREEVNQDGDIEQAREACYGSGFDSAADFAEHFLEETGGLEKVPENLRCYFDFEAYWNGELRFDFDFVRDDDGETWVFNRNC